MNENAGAGWTHAAIHTIRGTVGDRPAPVDEGTSMSGRVPRFQ